MVHFSYNSKMLPDLMCESEEVKIVLHYALVRIDRIHGSHRTPQL